MTFESQRVHAFFQQKWKLNKSEIESKIENAIHVFRETNLVLQLL